MSVLSTAQRLHVLAALVDGNSERAVSRLADVDRKTIARFVLRLGAAAQSLHNAQAHDLSCSVIESDEIWSYVGKKQARVDPAKDGPGVGEAYTFVGLAMPSRYVVAWKVGKRNQETADAYVADLRARLVVMPAMTSDGFAPYVSAIGKSFGPGVDYGQTIKNYTKGGRREGGDDHRYEPPRDPFITKKAIFGAPDLDKATTAHIERNNGTMRHHIGRMRCVFRRTRPPVPETAAPLPKPLAPRVPEGTARELPNGRGFLRVVPGGGGAPGPAPSPAAPPPPAPVAAVASLSPSPVEGSRQLDLFAWKPKPLPRGQLSLFGEEPTE